jgi:hypothetical protein
MHIGFADEDKQSGSRKLVCKEGGPSWKRQ